MQSTMPQERESGQIGDVDQPIAGLSQSDANTMAKALLDQTYRRVPLGADKKKDRDAEQCPHSGLNRNQLYELFKLRENGRRVITRVTLGQEGKSRGVQVYNVGSVLRHLDRLAAEQEQAGMAKT